MDNDIPSNIEYRNMNTAIKSDNNIVFKELETIKEAHSDWQITGYSEIITQASNVFNVTVPKVKLVLTDENYFKLYPKSILAGVFLDKSSIIEGSRGIAISETLANKLFKSINVIGNELKVMGERYWIVGVFKEDKSFLKQICEDGYERIYASYTSIAEGKKKPLEVLAIKDIPNENMHTVQDNLLNLVGKKLFAYSNIEYSSLKNNIWQIGYALFFAVGMVTAIFSFKLLIKYGQGLFQFLKCKTKEDYLSSVIKKENKKIAMTLCKMMICIGVIIVIFILVKFNLVIPDKYVPWDNIFDFEFYRDKIVSTLQLGNANLDNINNFYNRYISMLMKIQLISVFIAMLILIELTINAKLVIELNINFGNISKYFILFIPLVIILSFFIFYKVGLSIIIPAKYLTIFMLYIVSYFFSKRKIRI